MTYTTTVGRFEELTKKINKVFKKIDKFNPNVVHKFKEIKRYVKSIPVYAIVQNGAYAEKKFVQDTFVEVVDFELTIEEKVVAEVGAKVVAVLENVEQGKNFVYVVNKDNEDLYNHYANATLRCDHCKTNHNRKKVAIVERTNGEEIMVGLSCLKDYFGYDEDQVVSGFRQVEELVEDYTRSYIEEKEFNSCTRYTETAKYLAKCVAEIKANGYKNGYADKPTKFAAMKRTTVTEEDEVTAQKVIELFNNYNAEVDFDQNIKTAVTSEFCKVADGFVAYAYVAYLKVLEKESFRRKKEEAKEAEKAGSNYVGNVGDKVTLTVKVTHAGGYTTDFGYTNIWKFTDKDGNVFIWKTQNDIEGMWDYTDDKYRNGKEYKVTGKIKEHSEYNGTKQTILTRCKVCGAA